MSQDEQQQHYAHRDRQFDDASRTCFELVTGGVAADEQTTTEALLGHRATVVVVLAPDLDVTRQQTDLGRHVERPAAADVLVRTRCKVTHTENHATTRI